MDVLDEVVWLVEFEIVADVRVEGVEIEVEEE